MPRILLLRVTERLRPRCRARLGEPLAPERGPGPCFGYCTEIRQCSGTFASITAATLCGSTRWPSSLSISGRSATSHSSEGAIIRCVSASRSTSARSTGVEQVLHARRLGAGGRQALAELGGQEPLFGFAPAQFLNVAGQLGVDAVQQAGLLVLGPFVALAGLRRDLIGQRPVRLLGELLLGLSPLAWSGAASPSLSSSSSSPASRLSMSFDPGVGSDGSRAIWAALPVPSGVVMRFRLPVRARSADARRSSASARGFADGRARRSRGAQQGALANGSGPVERGGQ